MNDKASALLFGLALGDTLGYVTEFISLAEIKERYGQQGITQLPARAIFSDDTQMTIALAEGILDAGVNADIDSMMEAVASRFIEWRYSPENNRAPGLTCMSGIENYERDNDWRTAGIVSSKGCGSAMRVAPIGYLYQHNPQRLTEIAHASSAITHRHPTAFTAAIAGAYLVKLALDQVPVEEYMTRVMDFIEDDNDELHQAIRRVGHVLAWGSEEQALHHIGEGWIGEEAVALALYCVLKYPDDYLACIRRAANTDGDSDSIACIAGSIMGARLGMDAIPADWIDRCEKREYIIDLAARLTEAKGQVING